MGLSSDYELTIEYEGRICTVRELRNLKECRALSHAVMVKRLKEGYSAQDMMLSGRSFRKKFGTKKRISRKSEKYPYAGKIYTMASLLLLPECVVSKGCLTYRLRAGQDVHTAMTTPKGQNHGGKRVRGRRQTPKEVVEAKVKKPIYKMKLLKENEKQAKILSTIQTESKHTKEEQERIKRIMAVPVNKEKCRFTGHIVDKRDLSIESPDTYGLPAAGQTQKARN